MPGEEIRRRSRWMLRVLEWDDPRARYPNLWHQGMPRQVLAFETVASRLRLGDLVAIYHPASQKHPERSERFLGLCRVTGLRRADGPDHAWVDLEIAHRFAAPRDLGEAPRRVFLCCDAGWPGREVDLFRRVVKAAEEEGWLVSAEEREASAAAVPEPAGDGGEKEPSPAPPGAEETAAGSSVPAPAAAPVQPEGASIPRPEASARRFAGADYSGDMRDPRTGTWLALLALQGDDLVVERLEPTGRAGVQSSLRDSDRTVRGAEAIGLSFPFGLPLEFAERLLDGPFPEEGWWALARRLERLSLPQFLVAVQEFADAHGEPSRVTDATRGTVSPLHRVEPDLGSRAFHGIRMIAEERSRYAVRPFESAQGRLLLEVCPTAALRRMGLGNGGPRPPLGKVVEALEGLERLRVRLESPHRSRCLKHRDALDAVVAARCAALAVLDGEVDQTPEDLAPGQGDRVRLEGWIFGLS